jgi:hypothetical protein
VYPPDFLELLTLKQTIIETTNLNFDTRLKKWKFINNNKQYNLHSLSDISHSHGGEYEDDSLSEYCAM